MNWFHEYKVSFWDEEEHRMRSEVGIVIGTNFTEATAALEKFYGEELEKIELIAPIVDGNVFEFHDATEHCNFRYNIIKAEEDN